MIKLPDLNPLGIKPEQRSLKSNYEKTLEMKLARLSGLLGEAISELKALASRSPHQSMSMIRMHIAKDLEKKLTSINLELQKINYVEIE